MEVPQTKEAQNMSIREGQLAIAMLTAFERSHTFHKPPKSDQEIGGGGRERREINRIMKKKETEEIITQTDL